ncbi:hypothetical protein M0802_006478 [Mischocyttarus mexicanus]|nr:hypothetical protein M0802_006478 [Mischocyttarus mexicanus]
MILYEEVIFKVIVYVGGGGGGGGDLRPVFYWVGSSLETDIHLSCHLPGDLPVDLDSLWFITEYTVLINLSAS